MAKKKNPFDLIAKKEEAKEAKEKEAKEAKEKEAKKKTPPVKKEVPKPAAKKKAATKEETPKKRDKNAGRKLIRVHNSIYKMARWNDKYMDICDYVEAVIYLADIGAIDWTKFKKLDLVPHHQEPKKTLLRVNPHYHKLVKFNKKQMLIQDYAEAIIYLASIDAVDWTKFKIE